MEILVKSKKTAVIILFVSLDEEKKIIHYIDFYGKPGELSYA